MQKVKIKKTGEIKLVTNNVAYGLVDRGEGTIVHEPDTKEENLNKGEHGKKFYRNRQMTSKDRELR